MNRRDLLKLFGVGSSIVPLVGGAPLIEAGAKLIEVPKIEPVEFTPVKEPTMNFFMGRLYPLTMVVGFKDRDGQQCEFNCETYITECRPALHYFHGPNYDEPRSVYGRVKWSLEGVTLYPGFIPTPPQEKAQSRRTR